MVAQYYGAKAKESLSRSIGNAMTLVCVSSLVVMAIGIPLSGSLLRLTRTPVETFDMARSYLTIILWGVLGLGFYNIVSGILRGLGNSVFPLLTLLLTSCLNIVLDIWFVAGLDMGVAGAALATVIGNVVGSIYFIHYLVGKKTLLSIRLRDAKIDRDDASGVFGIGIPASLNSVLMSTAFILLNNVLNGYADGETIPSSINSLKAFLFFRSSAPKYSFIQSLESHSGAAESPTK